MKKTTFYTLLCTTIMFPSLSLAAEDPFATPIKTKVEKLKQQFVDQLPTSPQIKSEVTSKLRVDILSEKQAVYFTQKAVERKKDERDALKTQKFFEIEQEAAKERLLREEELNRKNVEEQAHMHGKLIEDAKKATSLKQEENETLNRKLSELASTIDSYTREIEVLGQKLELTEELSKEAIDELTGDLKERTKQLSDARAAQQKAQMNAATLKLQLTR